MHMRALQTLGRLSKRASRFVLQYALACALLGIAMFFAGCAETFILFPSTHAVATDRVRQAFDWSGGEVEVFIDRVGGRPGDAPQVFVLDFIGNADRAERSSLLPDDVWADGRRAEIWHVNPPGYGGSTGPARLKSFGPAALAVYDGFAKAAAGKPMLISGFSLGSTVALHVATQRPCTGMVIANPLPLRPMIFVRHGWWNLWLLAVPIWFQIPGELNAQATAPQVTVPAVFLSATRDRVIPPSFHRTVVDAYAGPKRVIELEGADHNDPPTRAEADRIRAAVADLLAGRLRE